MNKMMDNVDVILTDAANTVGRQVRSSLERAGYSVVTCDPFEGSGAEFRTFHSQDTENFLGQISSIVSETSARFLIPIFHPEVISAHRDRFPGVIIPVEEASKLTLLDDKVRVYGLASTLGIPQPGRYFTVDEVPDYPVVFKRSCGHGGDSVYFPKDRRRLENLVSNSAPGRYLVTEEIDGVDISVDALRWNGHFVAGAYEVLLPKAKGTSVVRRAVDAPEAVSCLKRIMDETGYAGVCGADFRLSDKGIFFLECNPRFCGGLDTMRASGLDFPLMLMRLAAGESDSFLSSAKFVPGAVTCIREEMEDYLSRRAARGLLTEEDMRISGMVPDIFCFS